MLMPSIAIPGSCARPQGLASTMSLQLYSRMLEDRIALTLGKAAAGKLSPAEAARAPALLESRASAKSALRRLTQANVRIAELS